MADPTPTISAPLVQSDIQTAQPSSVNQPIDNPNPGIVSSTMASNTLDQGGSTLDKMTSEPDPYLAALEKQVSGLQAGTDTTNAAAEKNDIATATTQASNLQNKAQSDYAAYSAGLQTLGIQSGLAEVAPELQAGRLIGAANDLTTKIQGIQKQEDLAVAKAQQARQTQDAVSLKDALAEIDSIKKEKQAAITQQLTQQTHDITVAKSVAPYAYKTLQSLPPEKKEAFILQTASDNGISPTALTNALASEQDTQTKFNLTTALQEKSLDKSTEDKPISQTQLNDIGAKNPLIDTTYGLTSQDVQNAISFAKGATDAINTDFKDPANLGPQGYFTYDYIKNSVLPNLPTGINKVAFMTQLYKNGQITPSLEKDDNYANYGLTKSEADQILANG